MATAVVSSSSATEATNQLQFPDIYNQTYLDLFSLSLSTSPIPLLLQIEKNQQRGKEKKSPPSVRQQLCSHCGKWRKNHLCLEDREPVRQRCARCGQLRRNHQCTITHTPVRQRCSRCGQLRKNHQCPFNGAIKKTKEESEENSMVSTSTSTSTSTEISVFDQGGQFQTIPSNDDDTDDNWVSGGAIVIESSPNQFETKKQTK